MVVGRTEPRDVVEAEANLQPHSLRSRAAGSSRCRSFL